MVKISLMVLFADTELLLVGAKNTVEKVNLVIMNTVSDKFLNFSELMFRL